MSDPVALITQRYRAALQEMSDLLDAKAFPAEGKEEAMDRFSRELGKVMTAVALSALPETDRKELLERMRSGSEDLPVLIGSRSGIFHKQVLKVMDTFLKTATTEFCRRLQA